ncbi:alpha/beta fold hydrolase [Mesorhizobium sp. M2D.F.Ca.ET.185.01.1.1]|uniref:alpha/beta hydrolase n=1 Tax=unclassified Mesorhizobium TaxID=325217 RepID=UPI000FC99A1C|nr:MULTISPECIES: alpha/beta fold hydrolase [unclassified Mesorhizobium]TGP67103.1 alpha/beta fold hydrolase [Mesorhizobium sp. M2D.F.Ca.ET.225.01.1.1]TGP78998.1 alpha/beta fold hydrolase [bacterium M00.F.Ca.ET.227.01.1.1]TGP89473.1 alpha/beta fold hydrolase [bacterium M00.F.Ca.ET.221.01.1.1]TGP94841.1 alpha/beta fold hydrolase [bacterium M00.F.Ca.ET.222.01.1.1]TGQ42859.1 alpha/beta fold hydrolase [Mesorhizobium sp. M00.F.Ca.ET.220.01.1.1]TGQ85309.1 alpha/beta fold hydrolase [Mesorhizobium sp.
MKFRALLALALAAMCIVGGIGTWRAGTMLIAREPRQTLTAPGDLPVERIALDQPGTPELVGWVAEHKGSCGAIVLLHGRGANRLANVQRAKMLFDAGYSVLLFDMSGHGESGGTVQGFGYSEGQDAARILTYARQRFPGQKIGALGSSLGAASFIFATPQALADAYVLEQLYATLRETTAWRMPFHALRSLQADILLAQMSVRLGFGADDVRPVDRIGKIGKPLILLAGGADPFIDRGQVAALHDAAPASQLVWFEGAGHVDLLRYDTPRYRDAVLPFLSTNLCQVGHV